MLARSSHSTGPSRSPNRCSDRACSAASSAYRHLAVLEQAGVVHRIVLGGEEHARFELAEALTDHHHHHLICSNCGAVDDFTVPAKLERAVADALDEVAANTGFKAAEHRFDLVARPCAGSEKMR